MARIELLYFPDCPNASAAREQLARALVSLGLPAKWTEHDVSAAGAPAHVQGYGSPTILVNGIDVTGSTSAGGASCRIYSGSEAKGAPPFELIVAALKTTKRTGGSASVVKRGLISAPAALIAILPVVGCPACWPAYLGTLSALGIPFLGEAKLLPITILALLLAVGSLALGASRRRGYWPLLIGVVASAGIFVGKFIVNADSLLYTSTALLVAASLWNSWPRRAQVCSSC